MRLGIIDLGTNSVRFDIHQIGPGARVKLLHREKIMVRLGQGVFLRGKLDRAAMHRTLQAFQKFKRVAAQLRTSKIVAFGTSALREVSDRDRLLTMIQKRTGIDVRVISGSEEAKLIALGILSNEKIPKGRFALVDIGGGSTEISICRGKLALRSASFPLGTARLQQVFLKRSPPDEQSIEELRLHIRTTLFKQMNQERWPKVERVLGSSGTIRAVAKMLKKPVKPSKQGWFDRDKLQDLVEKISGLGISELLMLPRTEPKRVDMIVGGSILLEETMKVLGAKKGAATEYSLRDGILREEVQLLRKGTTSHLSLHINDLYDKAVALGAIRRHLERTVRTGDAFFDRLAGLHKLSPQWKVYLSAAIILRNTGESISRVEHEKHSAYIVRHGDLPPMEDWEVDFIAGLCERHSGGKIVPKHLPFKKDRAKKIAFSRVTALLQIVDALDSGPDSHLEIKDIKRTPKEIQLFVGGRGVTGLEILTVEQRRDVFEKVFKRKISVTRI